MNLFTHSADCTPLVPCGACETVAWLRSRLSEEDFNSLIERVMDMEKPKRVYRRRGDKPSPDLVPEQGNA
jgi:hypothetical protein